MPQISDAMQAVDTATASDRRTNLRGFNDSVPAFAHGRNGGHQDAHSAQFLRSVPRQAVAFMIALDAVIAWHGEQIARHFNKITRQRRKIGDGSSAP